MTLVNVSLTETSVELPRKEIKEMIGVTQTPDGRPLVRINSSSIGTIQECLRKAQYQLHERWLPESEHPATIFGSAIHKALEVFYAGAVEDRLMPTWEACESLAYGHSTVQVNLILQAMSAFIEKAQPLAPLPDTDKRSIPNGVWILFNYFKSFINDPYIVYTDNEGAFLERRFTYRILDSDIVIDLFGTIDFAFRHINDGNVLVGDHKTSSSLNFNGQSYFDREKPNHQYTGYLLGAREVFGFTTNEFMVNVLEVKPKPKTARGSAPNFPRQITTRDADDFIEFTDVVEKVSRDYIYAMKNDKWPLGPVGACNSYGSCSYRAVCSAPKSLRKNILNAKFIQQQGSNNDDTSRHQAE